MCDNCDSTAETLTVPAVRGEEFHLCDDCHTIDRFMLTDLRVYLNPAGEPVMLAVTTNGDTRYYGPETDVKALRELFDSLST